MEGTNKHRKTTEFLYANCDLTLRELCISKLKYLEINLFRSKGYLQWKLPNTDVRTLKYTCAHTHIHTRIFLFHGWKS